MAFPPTYQGARTDSSSATPNDHATDHSTLDQADKDIVAEIVAHEALTTTAHGMAAAIAAAVAGYQPLDSDLTAIAALTTTSYGRAFLALADAAAGRTALGLGTAAVAATGDFDAAGAAAAAQAASQPLDSDLTAIAALSTTSFGRSLLTAADAAAARTAIGAGTGSGDALVANPLSQFAATTSAQLAGVLSDETGSGAAVFATSPTLVTPALGVASATSLTLSTDLAVADGGTGASTLTNHGVLLGQGTSAVAATSAGSAGAVLTSNGASADPTFQAVADSPAVLILTRSAFK